MKLLFEFMGVGRLLRALEAFWVAIELVIWCFRVGELFKFLVGVLVDGC